MKLNVTPWSKRLTALLLVLFMLVSMIPMTALATEPPTDPPVAEAVTTTEPAPLPEPEPEPQPEPEEVQEEQTARQDAAMAATVYQYVHVNGVTLGDGKYLASNNATTASSSSTEPSSYVAWYKNGVLTLNGYNGKYIQVYGIPKSDLTVKLKGSNTITSSYRAGIFQNGSGGSITVTADSSSGKLTINATYSHSVAGIDNGSAASDTLGDVTIKGYADVTIKAKTTGDSTKQGYGIYAKNAFILDNASVNITCETPNRISGSLCNGIYAKEAASINTAGKIKIDVTNAGKENAHSYGINVMGRSLTLTQAAEMVVEWRKGTAASTDGAPYTPTTASFDPGTYAVNVDTTNCYASYRKGTPYQVTAGNGKLTGPGVPNKMGSGMFLAGDKVSITPNEKTGRSGEVIPFQKWTSDDVTFDKSATTASNSFTVPAKNVVMVIAKHNPFDGKPTFTPTGDLNDRGVLTFKTVVKPYDQNEYFALVKVGNEGNYNNGINPDTSSQTKPYVYTYEATSGHSSRYVEPGEYYVAEKLDNWWYLSEKFTVNYVKPRPEISVSYWSDPTVFPSEEEGYAFAQGRILTIDNKGAADTGELTITVEGANPDAFTVSPSRIANIAASGSAMSTVRPAKGLTAGTYTATLKISGDNVNTLRRNVKFTVTNPNASATVDGTIKSYGSASEAVTVTLIPASGTPLTTTVIGNSVAYSFPAVPAGEYTLKVEKTGHTPFSKVISVDSNHVTENVTIYLVGDVNGDGAITADDLTALARHVAKISVITDTAALARCDVTKDGSVTADDLTMLARYVAKIISSFD